MDDVVWYEKVLVCCKLSIRSLFLKVEPMMKEEESLSARDAYI